MSNLTLSNLLSKVSLDDIRQERARRHLEHFTKYTFPSYICEPAHRLIAQVLDGVVNGYTDRLMIFAPPQHGKSELASVRLPAFWFGKHPDKPAILASYGASLAYSKSRQARAIVESLEYSEVFPDVTTNPESRARDNWSIKDHKGEFVAAGVGGPITGHGALCFPSETMISTEIGNVDIGTLCSTENKPLVMAYDHNKNQVVYKKIIAVRKSLTNELVEITTRNGRKVRATTRHPFYVQGQGYRQASLLNSGQRLITTKPKQQDLSSVRKAKEWTWLDVPKMLSRNTKEENRSGLCLVRRKFRERFVPTSKKSKKRFCRYILQQELLRITSCNKKRKEVCMVWWQHFIGASKSKVLLKEMPRRKKKLFERKERMPFVWNRIFVKEPQNGLLFKELCGYGSFRENERQRKFSFQERHKLCEMVYRDETIDSRKRQVSMCCLSHKGNIQTGIVGRTSHTEIEVSNTSYRSKSSEQQSIKLSYSLPDLPFKTSQLCEDEVELVEHIHSDGKPVYNIQVEGCSNYFAEGILVHNCGIIDDPIENWEQAQSQTIRDKIWEWYRTTFRTRIWEGGRIVIIMTRWHSDDLCGRLLEEQGDDWQVLRLPAIAETQKERDANNQFLGLPTGQPDPLRRKPGQPLCPKRFSKPALLELKNDVGSIGWGSQYQGVARLAEGNRFKRGWFEIVKAVPAKFDGLVRYWDKAGTAGGGDYTVGILMGVKDGVYYILNMVRGQWSTRNRENTMLQTAQLDLQNYGRQVKVHHEEEPGSSGKDSARATTTNLGGFPVFADRVTGSLEIRAEPMAAQAEAGNIKLLFGDWNKAFIDEVTGFPNATHDDIVAAASGAFNKIPRKRKAKARMVNLG